MDVLGTMRGTLSTLTGHKLEGGSSITQQYVKNVEVQQCTELTDPKKAQTCYQAATAITVSRKLQELRYAVDVSKRYSKDPHRSRRNAVTPSRRSGMREREREKAVPAGPRRAPAGTACLT